MKTFNVAPENQEYFQNVAIVDTLSANQNLTEGAFQINDTALVYAVRLTAGQQYSLQWYDQNLTGVYTEKLLVRLYDSSGQAYWPSARTNQSDSIHDFDATQEIALIYITREDTSSHSGTFALQVVEKTVSMSSASTIRDSNQYAVWASDNYFKDYPVADTLEVDGPYISSQLVSPELSSSQDTLVYVAIVNPGAQYVIKWDDVYDGSGAYNADIAVNVYTQNQSAYWTSSADNGYTGDDDILIAQDSVLYIMVCSFGNDRADSFGRFAVGIRSVDISSSPGGTSSSNSKITDGSETISSDFFSTQALMVNSAYTTGQLSQQGNQQADTLTYYTNVNPDQTYFINWDDVYAGSGLYTADVAVQVYDSLGTAYWSDWVDSGYDSNRKFTATTSLLYICIRSNSPSVSTSFGTFAIRLSSY